ncbi:MAG: helix-hairpin-helix domain-containing protein, partial [Phycisphaeraceae bacterium]|nr:helix-hairpin-helix domain-containing protein [Phycisphaeraceae bacterium]
MNHRSSTAALLLVVAVMLTVCLVAMLRLPAKQVEVAGTREITYWIDPNAADLDTLCLLPRIGRGIAQRIITDRDANGPFRSAADMARVPM